MTGPVGPDDHLDWFADNISWFEALPPERLGDAVPACPGWHVALVLNHLSIGMGLAYPFALRAAPDTSTEVMFADVPWPPAWPDDDDAPAEFSRHMGACLATYRNTRPDHACATYAGPGVAAFWFRRAAVETSLHRIDVAEALDLDPVHLTSARALDAVAETVEFTLPLAATLTDAPTGALRIVADDATFTVGTGEPVATIGAPPHDLLCALWGRHTDRVAVDGDPIVADQWLALAEQAFAGRA